MKKTGIIALILLYTIAVVGINFSVHYCGKRISSVSVTGTKKCCCKTEKKNSCCTTKYIKAKVNDTHTPGTKQTVSSPIAVPINTDSAVTSVIPSSSSLRLYFETAKPPPGMPLYLRDGNLRI